MLMGFMGGLNHRDAIVRGDVIAVAGQGAGLPLIHTMIGDMDPQVVLVSRAREYTENMAAAVMELLAQEVVVINTYSNGAGILESNGRKLRIHTMK